MKLTNPYFPPIGIQGTKLPVQGNQKQASEKISSFASHLQEAVEQQGTLTISKHAQTRLEQRKIDIDPQSWQMISEKVEQAKKMGINQSLVLLDQAALIVSAKNRTVITAMDRKEAATQIFSNINGTIIIDK